MTTILFHNEQTSGDTTITSTTYVDLNGWSAQTVTYDGNPIRLILDVPSAQNDNANALTTFRIVDGAGIEVGTAPVDQTATGRGRAARCAVLIPKAGTYELAVGQQVTFKVQGKVSAGTTTVHAFFNNATYGSTPAVFAGEEVA